jgi:hypothetical protein
MAHRSLLFATRRSWLESDYIRVENTSHRSVSNYVTMEVLHPIILVMFIQIIKNRRQIYKETKAI